jgi:hypothetical protein
MDLFLDFPLTITIFHVFCVNDVRGNSLNKSSKAQNSDDYFHLMISPPGGIGLSWQ